MQVIMSRNWNKAQWVKLDSRYDGECNGNAKKGVNHEYYKLISDSKHFTYGPYYTYLPFNSKMAI